MSISRLLDIRVVSVDPQENPSFQGPAALIEADVGKTRSPSGCLVPVPARTKHFGSRQLRPYVKAIIDTDDMRRCKPSAMLPRSRPEVTSYGDAS